MAGDFVVMDTRAVPESAPHQLALGGVLPDVENVAVLGGYKLNLLSKLAFLDRCRLDGKGGGIAGVLESWVLASGKRLVPDAVRRRVFGWRVSSFR
jgi:hypothetical protein